MRFGIFWNLEIFRFYYYLCTNMNVCIVYVCAYVHVCVCMFECECFDVLVCVCVYTWCMCEDTKDSLQELALRVELTQIGRLGRDIFPHWPISRAPFQFRKLIVRYIVHRHAPLKKTGLCNTIM